MKKVKILWAIALGLGYVVTLSFISALIVDVNSSWYRSLILPSFMPNNVLFSVAWGVVYLFFALTFAETFAKNVKISIILGYILIAIFNVCYLVFFFKLNDLLVSFIFCFIDVICVLLVGFALIKHRFCLSWLFLLIYIWYAFSLTLSYFILMTN